MPRSAPSPIALPTLAAALLLAVPFLAPLAPSASAQPVGDADRGRRAFTMCRSCHDVGRDATNRYGPHLNGLFGRRAGSIEDYAYSLPLVDAGLRGLVWNEETLDSYIQDPNSFVPNSKMPLIGVSDPKRRADIIAYLRAASAPGSEARARPEPKRR